ncbi:MAG: biotin transporter BioY [Pseudomonadota bacterium]
MAHASKATLAATLWPTSTNSLTRGVVIAIVGALLLTLAAKVKVPFYPVEMTMQTPVLVALALALGWRLALATVLLYLAQGAAGLPVFTGTPEKGIGLVYMMGATGGYLLGFALAAIAVGRLADAGWGRGAFSSLATALVGLALIYVPGVIWLAYLIGFEKAMLFGFWPFIAKDLVGTAVAALGVTAVWQLAERWRRPAA